MEFQGLQWNNFRYKLSHCRTADHVAYKNVAEHRTDASCKDKIYKLLVLTITVWNLLYYYSRCKNVTLNFNPQISLVYLWAFLLLVATRDIQHPVPDECYHE